MLFLRKGYISFFVRKSPNSIQKNPNKQIKPNRQNYDPDNLMAENPFVKIKAAPWDDCEGRAQPFAFTLFSAALLER